VRLIQIAPPAPKARMATPAAARAVAPCWSAVSFSFSKNDAEQHVDERIEIIAEAALEHVAVHHRVDIDQPVDSDQRPR
jgi:hypothetical protein